MIQLILIYSVGLTPFPLCTNVHKQIGFALPFSFLSVCDVAISCKLRCNRDWILKHTPKQWNRFPKRTWWHCNSEAIRWFRSWARAVSYPRGTASLNGRGHPSFLGRPLVLPISWLWPISLAVFKPRSCGWLLCPFKPRSCGWLLWTWIAGGTLL